MRRVMISGIWGALPGAVIIGVAALLHSMDVITSDQSQIAFIGVPLLALGLPIGLMSGAAKAGNSQAVLSGMGAGVAAGVALAMALTSVFPGAWLVLVPILMMAGAMFGAWRHDHRPPPPPLAQH